MKKKELKRIARVVRVLLKNGLGFLIDELNLKLHLPFTKRFLMDKKRVDDLAVRLRESMEELGGAFVKLGQLLSIRPDLVPIEFCDEFKKLLDQANPEKFSVIKKQIEKNLGKDINKVFKHIDPKPVGSASVAQVHKAKLINGRDVVIKVLRPGIKDKFDADIEVLRFIASKLENRLNNLPVKPKVIIDEFERYTNNELNLIFEARNIERFCKQRHSAKIVVPKVYWPATNKKILVMDYLPGKKLSEFRHPDKKLAEVILNELMKEVFDYGFFHGDLHPGNVIVMKEGKVGIIDFGIVGFINKNLKMLGLLLYNAVINKDPDAIFRVLLKYGSSSRDTNMSRLKHDVYKIVNEWYTGQGKEAKATHALYHLFVACTNNNFSVPENSVLFAKALVTAEGTCLYIDPKFNFVGYTKKKASKLLSKFKSPAALKKYFISETKKMFENAKDIPQKGLELIEKLDSGRFEFNLDDSHFRRIGFNISSSSNRLAYALIITALIIASAMLIEIGPFIDGYPVLSIIGLILAGILMVPLFLSIIREPKLPIH